MTRFLYDYQVETMLSIDALRKKPKMADKARLTPSPIGSSRCTGSRRRRRRRMSLRYDLPVRDLL